jgi:hypothetical protein
MEQPEQSHPSRLRPEQLFRSAKSAQFRTRDRDAVAEDSFLVTPVAETHPAHPNGTRPLTGKHVNGVMSSLAKLARGGKSHGRSENVIRKTLEPQHPDSITVISDPFPVTESLPGGTAVIDHLAVRAREEPGWSVLVPPIEEIRQHRIPPAGEAYNVVEVIVGISSSDHIKTVTQQVLDKKRGYENRFHFCCLAGDTESILIPTKVMDQLVDTRRPVTFPRPQPFAGGSGQEQFTVKLMIGHVGWAVHICIPVKSSVQDGRQFLTISPGTLQPELQELIDACGHLVGVGIHDDIGAFNFTLRSLFGATLSFPPPIDVSVVARLAGFNLPRAGVNNLVWVCLGGFLPKGVASVGDGLWYRQSHTLPLPLLRYLQGDVSQVALVFWVLVVCWVWNVFPDVHAVSKCSTTRSVIDILRHWVDVILVRRVSSLHPVNNWEPASSRQAIVERVAAGSTFLPLLLVLVPDWPSVVAGGCRYFHTARAWLVSILPALIEIDPGFWLSCYPEDIYFIKLGRDASPSPSPRQRTTWPHIGPNPEYRDILCVPAAAIDKKSFSSLVYPSHPKRLVLLEYVLCYPDEGARFLLRLEGSITLAHILFCTKAKATRFVRELREALTVLRSMPQRPQGWVDHYPGANPAPPRPRLQRAADKIIAASVKRANFYMRRRNEVFDVRDDPVALSRVVNRRGPGKPEDNARIFQHMGARPEDLVPDRSRQRSATRERSPSLRSISADSLRSCDPEDVMHREESPPPILRTIAVRPSVQPEAGSSSPQPGPSRSAVLMGGHAHRSVVHRSESPEPRRSADPSPESRPSKKSRARSRSSSSSSSGSSSSSSSSPSSELPQYAKEFKISKAIRNMSPAELKRLLRKTRPSDIERPKKRPKKRSKKRKSSRKDRK